MVKIAEVDLPITFTRNAHTIKIEFSNNESNYDKTVLIRLKSIIPSSISEWTYKHVLQPTTILNLTGLEYGDYQLEIKSLDSTIDNKFNVISQKNIMSFETIDTDPDTIFIEINDKNTNTRGFGGTFGGALLTSGSFTMMAASGGF